MRSSLKIPLLSFVTGIMLFFVPALVGWLAAANAPAGSAGESGWGVIIVGVFLWPIGIAFGLVGLIIFLKRYFQK